TSAELACDGRDPLANALAPRFEVGQHVATFTEGALIRGWRCDPNGLRRMKAVSTRMTARNGIEQRCGHHILAVEHQQPVHRSDELRAAGAPVHPSGYRKAVECRLHDLGKQVRHRGPRARSVVEEKGALALIESVQLLHTNTAVLGERQRSSSRVPCAVECCAHRWPASPDTLIRLPCLQLPDPHGKAPRSRKGTNLPVPESRFAETAAHSLRERMLQAAQRERRE